MLWWDGGRWHKVINYDYNTHTGGCTLKGSDGPKGSNADRSDGFPLNMAPEDANESPIGTEKAAKGSVLLVEVLAKGSERCLSSLPPSSPPSSR